MAEQEGLAWYEYQEAEEQIARLKKHIEEAQADLLQNHLSEFSRNAIMNEVQRHMMFIDDIREAQNEPLDTEPIVVIGVDDD